MSVPSERPSNEMMKIDKLPLASWHKFYTEPTSDQTDLTLPDSGMKQCASLLLFGYNINSMHLLYIL